MSGNLHTIREEKNHKNNFDHINLRKAKKIIKKSKSFCLIHSKEINHPAGSSLNKRVLKALNKADFVIANSKFTKELALKLGVKDVIVINPGCNYPLTVNEKSREFSKNKNENQNWRFSKGN